MVEKEKRIGLFGSCGKLDGWRKDFMEKYNELGIPFYNPQVANWDVSMAEKEAWHFANDSIILLPVIGETYGLGSLSESGFSILNAIRIDNLRYFVVLIENTPKDELKENINLYNESVRQRALAKEHFKKLRLDTLYLVESLEEMFEVSKVLYKMVDLASTISHFNPHRY